MRQTEILQSILTAACIRRRPERHKMKEKMKCVFIIVAVCYLFPACQMAAVPGQEPFGEQTHSEGEAQAVYADVCAGMAWAEFSGWRGYNIELDEDMVSHDFYHTEEYTAAWHEGVEKKYLWYQGRLYCYDGGTAAYREMGWEELQADSYAEHQWEFAMGLLTQEPAEVEYEYIPMASGSQYLLTAKYQETSWEGQPRQFPQMRFRLDGENHISSFTLHWQEGSRRVIDVSYSPYDGSASLQAERKIWGFACEVGLTEEGVPALSDQEDDREKCRSVITGIDFESLSERAVHQEDLAFPAPLEQDDEDCGSGSIAGEEANG